MKRIPVRRQRGAMAVEFGLVAFLLCTALIGAMEVGRLLWTWNAAAEATRLGARLAAVCTPNEPNIKKRMREQLPALNSDQIELSYINAGGGPGNVASTVFVRVSLQGYQHRLLVPLPSTLADIPIPSFTTTVRREVMLNANQPACTL